MSEKKIEGYWNSKKEPQYPMPIANVLTEHEAKKIYYLIKIKEKEAIKSAYRGLSPSRITNETLGNKEFSTDKWIWPGDFAKHYVLEHKVKPSADFLKYIGYDRR